MFILLFFADHILLALLIGGVICFNVAIIMKNRNLCRKIKRYSCGEGKSTYVAGKGPEKSEAFVGNKRQRDLVVHLNHYLRDKKALYNINISSKILVSALGTNKNLLSDAVKAVTGKTLMKYIRFLQLEEARRMLKHHPEQTIETIIMECGFNSASTFYRLFHKHYGVSPAKYRRLS